MILCYNLGLYSFQKQSKNQKTKQNKLPANFGNTVGTKSIQTPLKFSLFVLLQSFAKIKKFILFLINVTQHPILTEKK